MVLTEDAQSIFLNNVGTHLPDYLGIRARKTMPFAMAWLRQFVATFATWSLRFNPTPFHLRFVEEEVSLGQVLLQVLQISPVSIIPLLLHNH